MVAVVRPARIERGSFSCYDNFVPSNSVGSPSHCDDHGALEHLRLLLHHLQSPLSSPLCLIGFSKGVVVLNQLVRELSYQVRTPGLLEGFTQYFIFRRARAVTSTSARWCGWTEGITAGRIFG